MEGFVAATTATDALPDAETEGTDKHTFAINSRFICTRCGLCCRNVRQHEWYRDLDRGDGACRHFADATNLCTIYESRPDACRIDVMYDRHFAPHVPRAAFDAANHAACRALQAAAATTTD